MTFTYDDGGRKAAGFSGTAGDCVARAIAIAMQRPYAEVYAELADGNAAQRITKRERLAVTLKRRGARKVGKATAAHGINVTRQWFKDYMTSRGWTWVPTMKIGSGCKVHLKAEELPMGRLIVSVSKHYTTMINGVIHDTHNPQREPINTFGPYDAKLKRNPIIHTTGGRCVYGYWKQA